MDTVYGVIQFYQLDSGESSIHVDGYSTPELALRALSEEVLKTKEEILSNGYELVDEWDSGNEVFIRDSGDNRYSFKLDGISIVK